MLRLKKYAREFRTPERKQKIRKGSEAIRFPFCVGTLSGSVVFGYTFRVFCSKMRKSEVIPMTKNDISPTVSFDADQIRRENIRQVLLLVQEALEERGYNAINQLAGYLISNDPAYISSHKNARSIIQSVERHEIIEELVRFYLEENGKNKE